MHGTLGLRVLRVSRVVADLDRAEAFYRDGLGFRAAGRGPGDPETPELLGVPGATTSEVVMRLGAQEIALVRVAPEGPPYPAGSRSNDFWFQHLAIVVNHMGAAYRMLVRQRPRPISSDGPQTLPPRNGRVTAFKFRDPDGHPLELIRFPSGQGRPVWRQPGGPFLGIDHSALSVAATAPSLRFYRRLGFRVADRSFNYGLPQSRLDGLPGARVHVTGIRPAASDSMGLELLCYSPPGRPAAIRPGNARVTDWTTLLIPGLRQREMQRDPDGHLMLLTPP